MAVAVGMGVVGTAVSVGVNRVGEEVGNNVGDMLAVGIVVSVGSGVVVLVVVGGGWVGVLSVWLMETAVVVIVGVVKISIVSEHPTTPKLSKKSKKNHPKKRLAWFLDIVWEGLDRLRNPIVCENIGGTILRQAI